MLGPREREREGRVGALRHLKTKGFEGKGRRNTTLSRSGDGRVYLDEGNEGEESGEGDIGEGGSDTEVVLSYPIISYQKEQLKFSLSCRVLLINLQRRIFA